MNKKISQFVEIINLDNNTAFVPVIQGTPLFNAVIKPDKFIEDGGGMMLKDFVGTGATKSVDNSNNLGNLPAINYVTYTDNNQDVDLSDNTIYTKGIKINTTTPYIVQNPGEIGWNEVDGTFDMKLLNGTTLQVGQELYFYGKAIEPILNGDAVQIDSVQGNHLTFKKVVYSELSVYPQKFLGIATQHINKGNFGYITWFGKINSVYTHNWQLGDNLYISPLTGQLTNVQPQAPNIIIRVGSVVKLATGSAENGIIGIRPSFGMRLSDLNDVNGTPVNSTGQILVWDNVRKVFDFTDNIYNYQKIEEKGQPNGYTPLDENSKIPENFETDPVFSSSPASSITNIDIYNWNSSTINFQETIDDAEKRSKNFAVIMSIALG